MDRLDLMFRKKKQQPSKAMRYRQKLYTTLKKEGQQIEWKTASVAKLQDSLAQYMGDQKKMKKVYNFTSKAQQKRTDARNVQKVSSSPIGKRLSLPIHQFNRILGDLSAGEDRSLLVSLKDHYGSTIRTTVLRNRNFFGNDIWTSIAQESGSDPDFELTDNVMATDIDLRWISPPKHHRKRSEFFRYFTKANFDLEEFQVYQSIDKSNKANSEVPCFLFALKQAGVSDETLSMITATMFTYAATHDFIRKVAIDYNLHIKLLTYKAYDNRFDFNRTSYGDKSLPMIEMACVGQHLFAVKPTKVSMAAIKYPQFANHANFPSIHIRNGRIAKGEPKLLMSHQVIAQLYFNRDELLTPITLANAPELHNNKYGQIDFLDESALTNNWFKEIGTDEMYGSAPFTKKVDGETVAEPFQNVYFDLETFSDSKENIAARSAKNAKSHQDGNHIAYCAAWKVGNEPTQHAYGFSCVKTMLDSLPNNGNYLMWAHNAGFDSRFLIRLFSSFDARMGVIESGNSMKYLAGTYKERRIVIKDTKSFLATALSKMPAMFPGACDESTLEKESFPHDMMNASTFDGQLPLTSIKVEFNDYDNLVKNATKIGAIHDDKLDTPTYAIHYCKRDVDVLASCFERFRKQMIDRFNQDIYNHISMPGLAYAILNNMGCYENCYSMAGPCLEFVRKAIVGGRVMTRDNEKHHTKHEIVDFDAVSLYPSSMARLPGFAQGKPKLHSNTIPDSADYYISKVKITSISKKLHFPLLSVKEEGASRDFTNDIVGREFVIDKYALEDLVQFQGATYEVIQGLYWDQGFNSTITTAIEELFDERLLLKAVMNPLQNGIKLLMNASYGKLIQKPIIKSKRFIRGKKAIEEYTIKRIGRLIQRVPVSDNIALFEEHKPLNKHFSPAHLGVQILSMSKRIMNEVMCLAEDLDLKIWYQDTDSMHIDRESLPTLTQSFREKYNRELVGKGMGQFHSDFELDGAEGEVYATESLFIGKKTYVDFLACTGNDVEGVHKRMKGIPSKLITDPRKTYEGLFNGIAQEFDMTAACPIQIDNKSQRVSKRQAFSRIVKA